MPPDALNALLVEDDDAYAGLLLEEFSQASAGIAAAHVRTLHDAVSTVRSQPLDVVVLDLTLPDSEGLETLTRLHAAGGTLPILVLTGCDDDEMAVRAAQEGAEDYFVKDAIPPRLVVRAMRCVWERAQLRRQMAERESRFRALVEHSHELVMLLDEDFVCTYLSRAVNSVTGYEAKDFLGRRMDTYVHPDDQPAVQAAFARAALEPGSTRALEYRFQHRNGTLRYGEAVLVNRLDMPEVRAIVAHHRDVTQRKLAEHALATAQDRLRQGHKMEAVGRLAGGVAHDFNNILTAIFGYTDLLVDQFGADDPRLEDIQEVRRCAERAATLTRQLLAFSRKQVLQQRTVDVRDIVAGMQLLLTRLLGEDIRLDVVVPADLWPIRADPAQLEQVLMNLCINARDAMPDGGLVRISMENRDVSPREARERQGLRAGAYVVVAVSDTGVGIPDDVRQQIFEPFFTTKEQGKGTGLGLATVYGIVKQSGGGVYVDSSEGRGATFSIYLPRVGGAGDDAAGRPDPDLTSTA